MVAASGSMSYEDVQGMVVWIDVECARYASKILGLCYLEGPCIIIACLSSSHDLRVNGSKRQQQIQHAKEVYQVGRLAKLSQQRGCF